MTSVLVTGAAGVVGRAAMRSLAEAGYDAVGYDRVRLPDELAGVPHLQWIVGDVADLAALRRCFEDHGCEYVIHLAAVVATYGNAHPREATQVNVAGFANLLDVARLYGCRGVVYASSRSVYGNVGKAYAHPFYRPVRESMRCEPAAMYPATKRCAEIIASRFSEDFRLPVVMLRFGAIYGPGKSSNHGVTRIFSEAIEAAAAGRSIPIGGGDQREDFVYSRDIPRAMLCALALLRDKPRRALPLVCNIGSGQGVSIAEFAEEVRRATGATLEVRAGTGVMGRDCRQSFVMDDSRARTILGYRPAYDLAGGIADYVAMLRNTTTTTAPAGADN